MKAGYLFVYYDGLNRYYIRSEEPALQEAFAYPPNVLDDFTLLATAKALERIEQLTTENSQLRAESSGQKINLDQVSSELRKSQLWVGHLTQAQAADRLRIDGLMRESDAEHQRAEKLFQEREEERRRAEHLLYEREVERQRANQLWHEKEAERLRAEYILNGKV